jgi:bacterioferritin
MPQFARDVKEIRDRARRRIEEGAVTDAYRGDKERAITILNEALATEIVCVLRYMHHYFMATGVHGKSVANEFKEHADAERDHADQIADRIQQLGGKPDFNPRSLLERSVSQYVEGESLADMIREDLVAERIVIEVYIDMIRHFGDDDPTTRVMLEGILKDEEEHATDLTDLLYIVDPRSGEPTGVDPGTHPLDLNGGNGGRREPERKDRGGQQRGREQQRARQQSEREQQQRGNQQESERDRPQGRGPSFRQQESGRTFVGSDVPNPPQPIRNRGGNGGIKPIAGSFRGADNQQQRSGRRRRGGGGPGRAA